MLAPALQSQHHKRRPLSTVCFQKGTVCAASNGTFVVGRDHAKNICGLAGACEKAKTFADRRGHVKRGKMEGYAVHQGRSRTRYRVQRSANVGPTSTEQMLKNCLVDVYIL